MVKEMNGRTNAFLLPSLPTLTKTPQGVGIVATSFLTQQFLRGGQSGAEDGNYGEKFHGVW
jgi:hypothetical protein